MINYQSSPNVYEGLPEIDVIVNSNDASIEDYFDNSFEMDTEML